MIWHDGSGRRISIPDLIARQHEQHEPGQNDDNGHNDSVDKDVILFTITLVNEAAARDIFRNIGACPDNVSDTTAANRLAENKEAIENLRFFLMDLSMQGEIATTIKII